MPIYKYKCTNCTKITELFCSFSEKERHEKTLMCDYCKSNKLSPVFGINIISGEDNKENSCSSCSTGSCSGCGH